MKIAGCFLALVFACLAPAARAGEAEAKPKGKPKPGKKADAKPDPKAEPEGKADSGAKYDDRVVFDQLRRATSAAWQLIPNSRWALTKPKAFDDKRLTGQLAELGRAVKVLEGAAKKKDDPEALVAHRNNVKKRIGAFLAEMGEYKKAYAAAAAAEKELARLKKSSPRSGRRNNRNRNNRNDRNAMRRWSDSVTKARKKAEAATLAMNQRYVRAQMLCRAVVSTLASIRSSVRRIYETVIEKPVEVEFLVEVPAGFSKKAAKSAARGGGSSRSSLLEGSACTAEDFRRAVVHKERAFLEGLAGRMVLWRVLAVEAVTESGGRLTSRAMVRGSQTTFEFPPGRTPDGFRPGSSLLVAGEVHEVRGEWCVRVIGWGPWGKVEGGGAMNLCTWPEVEGE
ncbi:MAG: hypothetical protein ACYSU0_10175 [Planctomycetota bacterium]|jgi:hypothetical protein